MGYQSRKNKDVEFNDNEFKYINEILEEQIK